MSSKKIDLEIRKILDEILNILNKTNNDYKDKIQDITFEKQIFNDLVSNLEKIFSDANIVSRRYEFMTNDDSLVTSEIEYKFKDLLEIVKQFRINIGNIIKDAKNQKKDTITIVNKILDNQHFLTEKFIDIKEIIDQSIKNSNISEFDNFINLTTPHVSTDITIENFDKNIKNKYNFLSLELDSIKENSDTLTINTEKSLQKLQELNKKIQKIETEYLEVIKIATNKIYEELDETKNKILMKNYELYDEAKVLTDEFKLTHQDFITLVENAGIYNLTENYSKKSNEEKIQYQDYRKYTAWAIIAAIITTIIVLSIPVIEFWGNPQPVNAGYLTILSRLSISVMFFVLALYLSKQASKHYECYQENNRTFLQLAALEPFISRMSDEDKLKIRKKLVPIYFHQDKDGKFTSQSDEVDLPSNFMSVMSKLIDKIGSKNSTDESSRSKEKST
ncbi:hypothetical protein [Acinetobacter sp. MD2(2019)]|uniref:hypothetical protein n=1 Tax=Acinetobacter sp. MD2(2019) TaxID=2605273 RepID=UPI002D1E560E|nr:hypothetical protein [Acinetobacter sp. MD2(2019)]MEB3755103.1 hypothetical protein [Acinetobacter sp. MD2(2019)]